MNHDEPMFFKGQEIVWNCPPDPLSGYFIPSWIAMDNPENYSWWTTKDGKHFDRIGTPSPEDCPGSTISK